MNRFFTQEKSREILQRIQAAPYKSSYDPLKHRMVVEDETGNEAVYFRLPITIPALTESDIKQSEPVHYVMLLIQAGNCAIGYFENGVNLNHKVFRSYMVRKKQGKSQIKYLKTKGKSRAGSRVRLAETLEFFENINERLKDYFKAHEIHRIAISCSKTLIPYLYDSKVKTPFNKDDTRILKIPKHIHTPIYDILLDTNRFLLRGELIYEEQHQQMVDSLTGNIDDVQEDDESDDWE